MVMRTPVTLRGRQVERRSPLSPPTSGGTFESILAMMLELDRKHREVLAAANTVAQVGEKIAQIKKGDSGAPGLPGRSVDHEAVVRDVLNKVRKPEDGKSPGVDAIAGALLPLVLKHVDKNMPKPKKGEPGKTVVVTAEPADINTTVDAVFAALETGKKKLKIKHIDGIDSKFAEVRNAAAMGGPEIYGKNTWARGGGDTVAAGTNVSITSVNGKKVINASGGAALTPITVTGTIDDSNKNFTAATQPTLLNINGAFYLKTGGAYTWTYVGTTITLNQPVGLGGSIFGI